MAGICSLKKFSPGLLGGCTQLELTETLRTVGLFCTYFFIFTAQFNREGLLHFKGGRELEKIAQGRRDAKEKFKGG